MLYLQYVHKILLLMALFVLFGPASFYLGRLEESLLGVVLAVAAILAGALAIGIERQHWWLYASVLCMFPLLFFLDLIRSQSPYPALAFLFPFVEGILFYLAGSYWVTRKLSLLFAMSIFVSAKALLILYKYSTGDFYDLAFEFSDATATIGIAGFVLQRSFDAGVSLFGIISLYAADQSPVFPGQARQRKTECEIF